MWLGSSHSYIQQFVHHPDVRSSWSASFVQGKAVVMSCKKPFLINHASYGLCGLHAVIECGSMLSIMKAQQSCISCDLAGTIEQHAWCAISLMLPGASKAPKAGCTAVQMFVKLGQIGCCLDQMEVSKQQLNNTVLSCRDDLLLAQEPCTHYI